MTNHRPSFSPGLPRPRQRGQLSQDQVLDEDLFGVRRRSVGAAPRPPRPHVRHAALPRAHRPQGARAGRALCLHQGLRRQKRENVRQFTLFQSGLSEIQSGPSGRRTLLVDIKL